MGHRSTTFVFIIIAAVMAFSMVCLLFIDGSLLVEPVVPSVRWLVLFLLAVASLILLIYSLWQLNRQQRSVVQTEVVHAIVHEFQTPITAIRMAADVLDSPLTHNQPERTEKYVRIIREETERLQHQVETMLTLARADRNTLILNTEPIEVHHLLRSIAERHGDYLRLCLSVAEPFLLADRLHLTNVLHNLLDNAIKYSVGQPDILLRTEFSTMGLSITVQDRGVGISPQYVSQIFQPFFRVHDQHQPSVKGFGLGLSYVQRIVQAHHWRINVKSEPGLGSEFIIQIPKAALLAPRSADTVSA